MKSDVVTVSQGGRFMNILVCKQIPTAVQAAAYPLQMHSVTTE